MASLGSYPQRKINEIAYGFLFSRCQDFKLEAHPTFLKSWKPQKILPNDNTIKGIPIVNGTSCACPITLFNPFGFAKNVK